MLPPVAEARGVVQAEPTLAGGQAFPERQTTAPAEAFGERATAPYQQLREQQAEAPRAGAGGVSRLPAPIRLGKVRRTGIRSAGSAQGAGLAATRSRPKYRHQFIPRHGASTRAPPTPGTTLQTLIPRNTLLARKIPPPRNMVAIFRTPARPRGRRSGKLKSLGAAQPDASGSAWAFTTNVVPAGGRLAWLRPQGREGPRSIANAAGTSRPRQAGHSSCSPRPSRPPPWATFS